MKLFAWKMVFTLSIFSLLASCATTPSNQSSLPYDPNYSDEGFAARMPARVHTREKMVLIDPNVHAWGAYDKEGNLIRGGIATAGGAICPPDSDELDCRTGIGVFRITSLGDSECYSKVYPRPTGGGLMPYCMFFNHGQALHGSPDSIVIEQNVSHGCVRMRISDAEWMRNHFAAIGTKVVVVPYTN